MAHKNIIDNEELIKNFKSLKAERMLRKISKSRSVSPSKNNDSQDEQLKQCEQKIVTLDGEWTKIKTTFNSSLPASQLGSCKQTHANHKRNMTSVVDYIHKNSTDIHANEKGFSPLKTDITIKRETFPREITLCNKSEIIQERLNYSIGSCPHKDKSNNLECNDEINDDDLDNESTQINKVFTSTPFKNLLTLTNRTTYIKNSETTKKITRPSINYKISSVISKYKKRIGSSSASSCKNKQKTYKPLIITNHKIRHIECDVAEENVSVSILRHNKAQKKNPCATQPYGKLNASAYYKDKHKLISSFCKMPFIPAKLTTHKENSLIESPKLKSTSKPKSRKDLIIKQSLDKIQHKLKHSDIRGDKAYIL